MSNKKRTDDVEQKVTISADDCGNVRKYCGHFGVPSSEGLDDALASFIEDGSYENQLNVKLELCKWIINCEHESFKDELWDAPKKAAEEAVFDLQFDKDLKDTLSSDES